MMGVLATGLFAIPFNLNCTLIILIKDVGMDGISLLFKKHLCSNDILKEIAFSDNFFSFS